MSHVASVELKVISLEHLKAACKELGFEFLEGQSTYRWYGRYMADYGADDAAFKHGIKPDQYGKEAAHVLRHKDATYDIGVYHSPSGDGSYVLCYDNWNDGNGLEKVAGVGLTKLKTEYGVVTAMNQAKVLRQKTGKNWTAKRVTNATGQVQVKLRCTN